LIFLQTNFIVSKVSISMENILCCDQNNGIVEKDLRTLIWPWTLTKNVFKHMSASSNLNLHSNPNSNSNSDLKAQKRFRENEMTSCFQKVSRYCRKQYVGTTALWLSVIFVAADNKLNAESVG